MSIRELEQSTRLSKTFNLGAMVAGALRTAAFQEDRTMSDIVDTALTEWLVRFGYMAITDENEAGTANEGDTDE